MYQLEVAQNDAKYQPTPIENLRKDPAIIPLESTVPQEDPRVYKTPENMFLVLSNILELEEDLGAEIYPATPIHIDDYNLYDAMFHPEAENTTKDTFEEVAEDLQDLF